MSSIIKSQRIRSEAVIDFSIRQLDMILEDDILEDNSEKNNSTYEEVEKLNSYKQEEISEIEKNIDFKLKDAQEKINNMYADAFIRAREIESEAVKSKEKILLEAEIQKEQIIQDARENANTISKEALEEKRKIIEATENEIVETMIYLMRLIISNELTYDTRWLKMIVRKVLNKEEILGEVKLVISPNMYSRMSENNLDEICSLHENLIVVQSDKLNDTECELVCNQGSIVYDVTRGMEKMINDITLLLEVK